MHESTRYFLPVVAIKPHWYNIIPSTLQEPCHPVDLENPTILSILDDVIFEMYRTMYATSGVGLAAPQVGILWQLSVIDTRNTKDINEGRLLLINPEIVEVYEGTPKTRKKEAREKEEVGVEGCLSIPFHTADIPRYTKIRVKNYTLNNKIEYIEAEGYLARVIQHEIDHLNGITYLERLQTEEDLKVNEHGHLAMQALMSMDKLKVSEVLHTRLEKLSSNK